VLHFSFNSLRIKGLYTFRALLAHPQEALHKRHLVYCVRISVGCGTGAVQGHLHVSSITCSSSGGASQTAFGILRAYISWLWHRCSARTSTCFEHYLLILRKRCTNGIWYIACLCQSAVARLQCHSSIPNAICVSPPENEQVMLETCRGPSFSN
jgi:hypothetical protein